jgi:hypothetical protein
MRARAIVALSLSLASVFAASACGNGTFPNALPLYDPDGGPAPSEDSGTVAEDAAADASAEDAPPGDGGEAGPSGDATVGDGASDAGVELDGGDSGSPKDASSKDVANDSPG